MYTLFWSEIVQPHMPRPSPRFRQRRYRALNKPVDEEYEQLISDSYWKEREEEREFLAKEHAKLNWTFCYDDGCTVHYSAKISAGWFPQEKSRNRPPKLQREEAVLGKEETVSTDWGEAHDDASDPKQDESQKEGHHA